MKGKRSYLKGGYTYGQELEETRLQDNVMSIRGKEKKMDDRS